MEKEYSEITIIIIAGTITFLMLGAFIMLFIFFYQKRHNSHIAEKQLLQTQFHQTLLQSQIEIQEQTLRHISRELHDNLGLAATLIKINLNTLKLDDAAATAEKVEATKDLTRQLITDIKSLSVSLSSDRIAQTGIVKALQTEAERVNKTGLFTANFVFDGNPPNIENDKAIILYRMAQEVLNNSIKHSHAKQISINLTVSESLFTLAISDDGNGFDLSKHSSSGSGLTNLQQRASLINASLSMQSSPGNGSRVFIEMPI